MNGLVTLADLPELKGSDPAPRAEIAIARLDDKLRDPRYGKFAITQNDVDGWKQNLSGVFGGRVSIDADHSSDRGGGTKAAAWIEDIRQRGKLVTASVRFTPDGARKVRDREYLYMSPTFVQDYVDEHGEHHGRALLGAAMTNRPVLRKGMPTLSLSRDPFDGVATSPGGATGAKRQRKHARRLLARLAGEGNQLAVTLSVSQAERDKAHAAGNSLPDKSYPINNRAQLHSAAVLAASKHGNWKAAQALIRRRATELGVQLTTLPGFAQTAKQASSDSRGTMDLKTLAASLGLDENADQAAILAHVAQLLAVEPTDKPTPGPLTLSKAGKKGKKNKKSKKGQPTSMSLSLEPEEMAQLITAANAGQAAAAQLAQQRFTTEWTRTLSEGRVAPAQEENFRALFATDPELAVKTLSGLQRIVPTIAAGGGVGPGAPTGSAPPGVDAARFEMDVQARARAKTLAKERDIPVEDAYVLAAIELDEGSENGF